MKSLHHAMMGVALLAVLTVALGITQPWTPAAQAQHGHGLSTEEQFDAFATHLGLTDEQRELVAAPFREGLGALQNLQRLHGLILVELNDEQQEQFTDLIHQMAGSAFGGQGQGQ